MQFIKKKILRSRVQIKSTENTKIKKRRNKDPKYRKLRKIYKNMIYL